MSSGWPRGPFWARGRRETEFAARKKLLCRNPEVAAAGTQRTNPNRGLSLQAASSISGSSAPPADGIPSYPKPAKASRARSQPTEQQPDGLTTQPVNQGLSRPVTISKRVQNIVFWYPEWKIISEKGLSTKHTGRGEKECPHT
jgi:hypothetical protein